MRKLLGKKILTLMPVVVRDSVLSRGQQRLAEQSGFSILTHHKVLLALWGAQRPSSVCWLCPEVTCLRCGPHPCLLTHQSPTLRQTLCSWKHAELSQGHPSNNTHFPHVLNRFAFQHKFLISKEALCFVLGDFHPDISFSEKRKGEENFFVIVKFIRFFWIEVGVGKGEGRWERILTSVINVLMVCTLGTQSCNWPWKDNFHMWESGKSFLEKSMHNWSRSFRLTC